jgi:hypothetical protein
MAEPAAPAPELFETVLQPDEIDAYLADLAACAEDVTVTLRHGRLPLPQADARHLDLPAAIRRLRDGEATGMQVRYRFDHLAWCDTLTLVPQGMRLVRLALPPG